jgi:signal transduction histidine kinase
MRTSHPPEVVARLAQNARRRERARIAQDIHDDLGQSLLAIRMELTNIRAVDNAARLDGVIRNVDASIASLRAIVHHLRPAALEAGLAEAVRCQLEEFARTTGIRQSLELDLRPGIQIPDHWAEAAFRILQEALANSARHARAGEVHVVLRAAHGALELCISDNGRGGACATSGCGLPGMAARADALGGEFHCHSPVGGGTTVRLALKSA